MFLLGLKTKILIALVDQWTMNFLSKNLGISQKLKLLYCSFLEILSLFFFIFIVDTMLAAQYMVLQYDLPVIDN